jgi:hypothetical protein
VQGSTLHLAVCGNYSKYEVDALRNAGSSAQTHKPAKKPIRPWWRRFIDYIKRNVHERRTKRANEKPEERSARLTAKATIWMAVFTVVLAAVSGGTLWVLKKQLAEMQSTGEQTDQMICLYGQQLAELQRQSLDTHGFAAASTYQAIAVAQSESARVQPIVGQPVLTLLQPIEIPYQLANSGKTRAEKVRFVGDATLWPRNGKDPKFSYSKDSAMLSEEIMASGETSTRTVKGITGIRALDHGHPIFLDTKILTAYQEGSKDIVMWGKLTYIDVFGVEHWQHFCTVFAQHQKGDLIGPSHEGCSAYNKSDKNQILPNKFEPITAMQPVPRVPCPVKNPN